MAVFIGRSIKQWQVCIVVPLLHMDTHAHTHTHNYFWLGGAKPQPLTCCDGIGWIFSLQSNTSHSLNLWSDWLCLFENRGRACTVMERRSRAWSSVLMFRYTAEWKWGYSRGYFPLYCRMEMGIFSCLCSVIQFLGGCDKSGSPGWMN
jgi:hypothetical protein